MSDDLIPVLVTVRKADGKVSVLMLLETPVGTALYEGDVYKAIGQITPATWTERNPRTKAVTQKKGWSWWYDEAEYGSESGHATTSKAAIAAVLNAGGYVEAPPNATNQGLF